MTPKGGQLPKAVSTTSDNFDGPSVIQVVKIPASMEAYVATSEMILLHFPGLSVSYINS